MLNKNIITSILNDILSKFRFSHHFQELYISKSLFEYQAWMQHEIYLFQNFYYILKRFVQGI